MVLNRKHVNILRKRLPLFLITTKEYNSDIFGFYSYAKRYFLTYEDMINYNWDEKYGDTQFFVDVDFNIKRTGLIIRSEENTE